MSTDRPTRKELEEKISRLEQALASCADSNRHGYEDRQFLQILLDTIPSPIFYKDRNGVYRHCNEAFSRQILGIDRGQIVNRSLFDLPEQIPVELARVYAKKDQELLDNPGTQIYRNEVKCADGMIRVFQFYKSTIMAESGEVAGLVGVMLDVTSIVESRDRLEKERSELESLSYVDPLTGLFNRRKFDSVFQQLLERPLPHDHVMNCAIIDIDHFKSYNDFYGHPRGDDALRLVADAISEAMRRPDDYAFRIGGEEFCLVFRSRDEAGALSVAEKIRSHVFELEIPHEHVEGAGVVTISIGLLSIRGAADRSGLYEEADRLLYVAKNAGRNRVEQKVVH